MLIQMLLWWALNSFWGLTLLWVIPVKKYNIIGRTLLQRSFLYYGGKLFTTFVGSPLKSFVSLRGGVGLAFEDFHFMLDLSLWSTFHPAGIPCGKSLILHGSPEKYPLGENTPEKNIHLREMFSDVFFIFASSRQNLVDHHMHTLFYIYTPTYIYIIYCMYINIGLLGSYIMHTMSYATFIWQNPDNLSFHSAIFKMQNNADRDSLCLPTSNYPNISKLKLSYACFLPKGEYSLKAWVKSLQPFSALVLGVVKTRQRNLII